MDCESSLKLGLAFSGADCSWSSSDEYDVSISREEGINRKVEDECGAIAILHKSDDGLRESRKSCQFRAFSLERKIPR
jgi:hypothetical protein